MEVGGSIYPHFWCPSILLMAEIRRAPVEVGSLSTIIYDGFYTS